MAGHTEYALRRSSIPQVIYLPFTIATSEAVCAKCLIPCQYGQVFDLVVACAAAVCAIVADERSIAEQEEIGIRVEESAASIAAKAVDMPSIASCGYCQ